MALAFVFKKGGNGFNDTDFAAGIYNFFCKSLFIS